LRVPDSNREWNLRALIVSWFRRMKMVRYFAKVRTKYWIVAYHAIRDGKSER